MPALTHKVERRARFLRMAVLGPTGSGKTYSGLAIGSSLAELSGGRLVVIDSERGSASLYADEFDFAGIELERFSPDDYIAAINLCEGEGFKTILVDSLSHAWAGRDGALEMVDRYAAKDPKKNSFDAWRKVTPKHNELVDRLLTVRAHVIVTMRTKMEYVQEKDDRGKTVVRKVGLQPVQRDGLEYEFDVAGDMDHENLLEISKTRCKALKGKSFLRPGKELARTLHGWCETGQRIDSWEADILARVAAASSAPELNLVWNECLKRPKEVQERFSSAFNARARAIKALGSSPDVTKAPAPPPSQPSMLENDWIVSVSQTMSPTVLDEVYRDAKAHAERGQISAGCLKRVEEACREKKRVIGLAQSDTQERAS